MVMKSENHISKVSHESAKSEIRRRIIRYIDDYGWGWGVVKHQINCFFGTSYTVQQLQQLRKLTLAEREKLNDL